MYLSQARRGGLHAADAGLAHGTRAVRCRALRDAGHSLPDDGGRLQPDGIVRIGVDGTDLRPQALARAERHDRAEGALVAIHAATINRDHPPIAESRAMVKAQAPPPPPPGVFASMRAGSAAFRSRFRRLRDPLILSSHKIGGPKGVAR